jgi:hypothetical protein
MTPFMKTTFKILLLLLLFPAIAGYAQKQNNIWYFGNGAGLDFNSGSPVVLTNSQMGAFEGCSVISDTNGNLLFYTNGGKFTSGLNNYPGGVWNRNHQLMPNGSLDSSGGCNSAAQSCIIVPDPASDHQYYIFTVDCQENSMHGGLCYALVDMSLQGGLGDVTTKGNKILDSVAESLCVIPDKTREGWWIVVHKLYSSRFYAFLLNSSGIQAPVISDAGYSVWPSAGSLVASPDGSKLAHCITYKTSLFNFDKSTGIVSNAIDLDKTSFAGVFSSSCRYLFIRANDPPDTHIYRFDLLASDIPASALELESIDTPYRPMQLGPDGKIYIVPGMFSTQYLDVINQPEAPGSNVDYQHDAVYLGGKYTEASLPVLIISLYGNCGFSQSGIRDQQTQETLRLFPNPATDAVSITMGDFSGEEVRLDFLDMTGRTILTTPCQGGSCDIRSLPAGYYIVRLMNRGIPGARMKLLKL